MANAEQGLPDPNNESATSEESFDAKRMNEEIQEGEREAPDVNVEGDYEQSKQFSQPQAEGSTAAGNPDNFRATAREIGRKSSR
ncbi:MAG: hypothetical protein Kow00121_29980 [Elainellaceae cyanobacterium]